MRMVPETEQRKSHSTLCVGSAIDGVGPKTGEERQGWGGAEHNHL